MKKLISVLLSMALIVTMLPLQASTQVAHAASQFFTFSDFSTVIDAPTTVNSNRVNLAGSFSDVSAQTITYSVQRIVNGKPADIPSNGTAAPLITNNNFMFTGIELFEGLNAITVSGLSSKNDGIVSSTSYVSFNNVPVITDIELAGGIKLLDGVEEVVSIEKPTILIKASNATEVAVNGTVAFNGAGGTYIHSGLVLTMGLNTIEVVARNAGKTYTVTRKIIYFPNNAATAHNVIARKDTKNFIQLDTREVIQPFSDHTLEGKVVVRLPKPDESTAEPVISLEFNKDSGTPSMITVHPDNVELVRTTSTFKEYSFKTTDTVSATANGLYTVKVKVSHLGQNYSPLIPFTVRNQSSPYIKDIRQLYGVKITSGSEVSFSSDTKLSNNSTMFKMPLWLVVDANNFNLSNGQHEASIAARLNNVPITDSSFKHTVFTSTISSPSGVDIIRRVYRIDALPEGEITLEFKIDDKTNVYTTTRTFKNSPISSIQVSNVYNGEQFKGDTSALKHIKGSLINFYLPQDATTLEFTMNGRTVPMDLKNIADITGDPNDFNWINYATNEFSFNLPSELVYGANEIVISGKANGIQVSTKLMVYLFSITQPAITPIKPVPHVRNPNLDTPGDKRRVDNDDAKKFKLLTTTTSSFTTTEKYVDLLFTVSNMENLTVQEDGKPLFTTGVDGSGIVINDSNKGYLFPENNNAAQKIYELRLFGIELKESGSKSISITAKSGSESITQTITITKEATPYQILSPMLPQEKVVNQNFLNVSIRAVGADSIMIGKQAMSKKSTEPLFRYQVKNLKPGNNTIKFTVIRGAEKLNGQFSVNYAADNTVGAQYKTSLASNGKISAFKGEITMSFPKNTFLRQANINPGQPIDNPDLFDSQEILFGIADRKDGRSVKIYNDVSDNASGVAQDGTFKTVSYDEIGAAVITPLMHFGYASNLFWVDPGYKTGTYMEGYQFKNGSHPYETGNSFFARPLDKWLEPSNKGTITLKYDSAIRDVMANTLSIWRYYNGGWTNVGGIINPKNNTITAPIDGFGFYAVKMMRFSYPDVIGHPYARNSIELMYSRGMMNSKDFNEFGVYDNITRGEFAQLLVKMFQIPLDYDNNMTFADVPPISGISNLWDYRYIETAARKGIIRGSGAQVFLPNESLTREDAAVMIARAGELLKTTGDNFEKDRKSLQKEFTDSNVIENYSLSSVLAVTKAKFIEGLPNTQLEGKPTFRFDPKSQLKRADAAIIAERVMRKKKFI
ncbi:S-layer homology domain-containing protein [Paenibacillus sp. GSMTC-2017]|uniref:S-layer homology domain-containing protein n=1 Tax=Paenibacillus sp. GSMTC-2017 TaxID=2794350 RepID=UPI0018D79B24|nr:S-layer homology domain-containing protein [Paenibacillus sp. GSMTC-2017]MBH5320601.1 S-layer homology domain-containing protein [Paenibacillus sp. GSMTC-2017]